MVQLVEVLKALLAWASPLLLVAGLLALAERRDRRARGEIARQTRISDALADEVGPVVAPVVRRRFGRWRIAVGVPLERPALVARVLGVLHHTLGRLDADRYEIVLTPRKPAARACPRSTERRLRAA